MSHQILLDIALATSDFTVKELGDEFNTAECDLASMIKRGGITVDAHAQRKIGESLRFGLQQINQEHWPQLIVATMAVLQGLCPQATWATWQRLNGC